MNEIVKYDWNGEQITLTPDDVRKYISTDERVTDKEVFLFLKLCQAQKLNPFVREAYLIKYGTETAQMVVGKETFLKRAEASKDFDGFDITDKGKIPEYSVTCKIYRKNLEHPITVTVDYTEYVGTTKTGNINRMWKIKPKTMLRKVALMQGLREAFPTALGGLYEESELQQQVKPIDITAEEEEAETIKDKEVRKKTDYVKEGREVENEIEQVPEDKTQDIPEDMRPQTSPLDEPASPPQLRALKWNKIPIPKGCTKGQADELIKASMAKSKSKPKEKLNRGDGQEALIPEEE